MKLIQIFFLTFLLLSPGITAAKELGDTIKDLVMAEHGFFKMGRITGHKLKLITSNDNPLHGLLKGLEITEQGDGIEGDDLGNTFGGSVTLETQYDRGSISLRSYTNVYGRKSPLIEYRGTKYPIITRFDEEGKIYAESISIDGVELEVIRTVKNDLYVKVIAGVKSIKDGDGVGLQIQDGWHKLRDVTRYHYLDHRIDKSGVDIYLEIGKTLELLRFGPVRAIATAAIGGKLSSFGDEDSYGQIEGNLKLEYVKERPFSESEYTAWELRAYQREQKYGDGENGDSRGVEATFRVPFGKKSYFYIIGGVGNINGPFDRLYGTNYDGTGHGVDDLQHYIGAGIEVRR